MINFKIFTLFPELFPGPLDISITGNALKNKLWSFEAINIRDYAIYLRKTVDDEPYGGGAGMIIKPDILANALEENIQNIKSNPKIIYLSPRGKVFNQKMAEELSKKQEISLICGRYEGIDQRVIDEFAIEEISIGDYILSGGELASYILIDAIVRNIDGVLGKNESLLEESFGTKKNSEYEKLLEYPHYTRPASWRNRLVPEILLSGHHKKIKEWRKEQAKIITAKVRPDLVENIKK